MLSGAGMDDRVSNDLASLRIDRQRPPPSSGRALRWMAALVLVGALGFVGWKVGMPALEARVFQTQVTLTEIAVVSPAQAQVQLTSTGYVMPQVVVSIASKVLGRVEKITVHEGDPVKTGQLLVQLDALDQHTQIVSAQARVASARAKTAAARAQLAEIQLQFQRESRLAASGAVSQASADDLGARSKSLEEQVHASEADVAAAQAEVNALTVNLTNLTLLAPIDGRVMLQPIVLGDTATPGLILFNIADLSSILVETDVPEARLGRAKKGAPCEIVLDAYPEKRWRGEVALISPTLNRAKATATVKVRFLDRDDTILPEMAARVSFLDAPLDMAKLAEPPKKVVPGTAVVDRSGAKVVFVADGGKVRMTPVTLGKPFGDGFELLDGPAPGTKLVADPPATLADGQSFKERSP